MDKNEIIKAVQDRVIQQQEKGLRKYGTLVNKKHYSLGGWMEHALQEQTDNLVYLQAQKLVIQEIKDELFDIAALIHVGIKKEAYVRLKALHERL
jgi:phospholipase C